MNFDNDHPFEFYAARTVRSRPRFFPRLEAVEMGLGGISSHLDRDMAWLAGFGFDKPPARHLAALQWAARLARMDDPPLCEIYPLPERLKLYYWFDFGDDWKFEIKKARHPKPPERRVNTRASSKRLAPIRCNIRTSMSKKLSEARQACARIHIKSHERPSRFSGCRQRAADAASRRASGGACFAAFDCRAGGV